MGELDQQQNGSRMLVGAEDSEAALLNHSGPRRRVLIVDDNRDTAKSLSMLLQMEGHEVTVANDGPSALDAARDGIPDVMLLDLGLPGMDGFEVADRLRRDPKLHNIFLVALTGYGQDEDLRRTREAGFDAHLIKPVKLDALNQLILSPRSTIPEERQPREA